MKCLEELRVTHRVRGHELAGIDVAIETGGGNSGVEVKQRFCINTE